MVLANQRDYVAQDPLELNLYVFWAPADFDLQTLGLTKIKGAYYNWLPEFNLEVWIIGESHLWKLRFKDKCLVKILACVELAIQAEFCLNLNAQRLFAGNEIILADCNGEKLRYSLMVSKQKYCANQQYDLIGDFLQAEFPANNGLLPARTLVCPSLIDVTKNIIHFQSVHEYPNAQATVLTFSSILRL